ncbi:ThiF family adenylyltransferase [Elizabethkingia anophelis]|uniref:ThiF family adenylyltransferase n=1 Tax=Elizabethkingia anophelis TaxID=1117645 RepID=UPI003891A33E
MIEKVINEISKTEDAKIINAKDIIGNDHVKKYDQVISVITELSLNTGIKIIQLYIAFKEPYSLNLPQIFIDKKSYDEIKYIPHVNSDLSICIIDQGDGFYFDVDKLPEITVELIAKTKIILRGIDDENYLKTEFEREFLAYWNITYSKNEKSQEIGLCLVDFQNFENLKGIKFIDKFGIYKYLIYNDENNFKLFQNYLNIKGIKSSEIQIFLADFDEIKPPYNISYSQSLRYLRDQSNFRSKINKLKAEDFIIVFRNSYSELYGWTYPVLNKIVKGFRPISNWQFLNSNLSKDCYVNRLSFSNISPKRLDIRTNGNEINRELKIALIGIGSIGSNLLHYLNKYPVSEYCLIDPDRLKIENIFRNKFGFNYINHLKTDIGKYEILSKNPFTNVVSFPKDISLLLREKPNLLESYSYRFIILGISRIEKYIIQHLISIKSDKPIIIIWVEPYLASGQLIYLCPEDFKKGIDLITDYPYHVIKSGQNLSMKEGSCQTGYMPYSDISLGLFLSSINPILYDILIENNNKSSKIYSWIGDVDKMQKMNISIFDKYKSINKFSLLENEF